MLALAETKEGPFYDTPWADSLVALGARAFRFATDSNKLPESDQLFIVISVPVRDVAASLIAAGWMLTAPFPQRQDTATQIGALERGALVRMVANKNVILDTFWEQQTDGTVHVGGSRFYSRVISGIRYVDKQNAKLCKWEIPPPPSFGPYGPERWADFMFSPPLGLAIVGAKTATLADLETWVTKKGEPTAPTRLRDIVLPEEGPVPTWATTLLSPGSLSDDLDDAPEFEAVVLDGASAIRVVDLVDTPVAVAVIDRSVMDDSAAEFVAQRRNTRGTPVNLIVDLGWRPPDGVEAIAFRTRR
jgi:hypothetical protein